MKAERGSAEPHVASIDQSGFAQKFSEVQIYRFTTMPVILNLISYGVPLLIATALYAAGQAKTLVDFTVLLSLGSLASYTSTLRFDAALLTTQVPARRRRLVELSILCAVVSVPIMGWLAHLLFSSTANISEFIFFFAVCSLNLLVRSSLNSNAKPISLSIYNLKANTFIPTSCLLITIDPFAHAGIAILLIFALWQIVRVYRCEWTGPTGARTTPRKLVLTAVRFRKFPIFAYPAIILSSIVAQFVTLVSPAIYSGSVSQLASFLFAWRVAALPITVLGPTYSHKFVAEISDKKKISRSYARNMTLGAGLALLVLFAALFSSVALYWLGADADVPMLLYVVAFSAINLLRLPATIVSPVIYVFERQELGIVCHLITILCLSLLSALAVRTDLSLELYAISIVIAFLFSYSFHLVIWTRLVTRST